MKKTKNVAKKPSSSAYNINKGNLSAYWNFLRSKYELYTGAVKVNSLPYIIGLDASSACQLRCPFCATGVENQSRVDGDNIKFRNRTMLSPELFSEVLEELGDSLFVIMFYNWGEPLLNRNLPDLIRRARERDIVTTIHSNLSLPLSEEYLTDLLSAGLTEFGASVDGFTQETYERYRRGGDLELVKHNLEKLARIRDRHGFDTKICWNFLVFSFNEHEIPEVERYCDDIGIQFLTRDANVNDPEWLPSYRKPEEVASPPALAGSPEAPGPSKLGSGSSPCGWHYGYSMINADGSVSPCCASTRQEDDLGQIVPGQKGFGELWNGDNYRKSRAFLAGQEEKGLDDVETLCMKCPYDLPIMHLYSGMDVIVKSQFIRTFRNKDALLKQAFDLLEDREQFVENFERIQESAAVEV